MNGLVYQNAHLPAGTLNLEIISSLEKKIVIVNDDKMTLSPFFSYVNNILVKFGFLIYAKDSIKKVNGIIKNSGIIVNYHLSNFIFDTKALLDSLSITLNDFYKLGFVGGDIDLNKGKFCDALLKKCSRLKDLLKNEQSWIEEVVKWRDALIHRKAMVVVPHAKEGHDPSFEELGLMKVEMPIEPISINELITETHNLHKKYGKSLRAIDSFCEEWISHAKTLVENILESIENDFQK